MNRACRRMLGRCALDRSDHSRIRAVATPLACANTVLLKTSELYPETRRLIGEKLCHQKQSKARGQP